ncbi:galactose oxidase [Pedobacter ginsengisoli]|uniref:galactose oxidase n=1 Tax=Pedobacter ginsengisoli TaxID=363852 RepID=UPI002550A89C|nr:galactose oxidase [Pedobacter ginsengisoli]
MKLKFYVIFFIFLLLGGARVNGQAYGLAFGGHDVVQDKRTALDLSPQPLCLDHNFQLSFDLSFMQGYTDYFGYVFRVIDQNKRNIDLIYDMRFLENKHFKLIIGDRLSRISFDIPIADMYKGWHNIKMSFDREKQQLKLSAAGKTYVQSLQLKGGCYKILFGANDFEEFKVKDVPPMKVRDIKILHDGQLRYHWPLDEKSGPVVREKVQGKNADVLNPVWIKKMHHDWNLVKAIDVPGAASVAFNRNKEELYIVSEDSLMVYSVSGRKLKALSYRSGRQPLLSGNQSLYDPHTGKLFNFYMDQKLVSFFDFSTRTWDLKCDTPAVITNFWHPNKFYSVADSSFYMIGGYGQYQYKNEVARYQFSTKTWEMVLTKGDYMPRYLAALGAVDSGAYLLGGYGSKTGEQILNPKNIYELSFFDARLKRFRKLFELQPKNEDFALANSLVVDQSDQSYYALTFSNHRYNSSLQLIKGSLKSPEYNYMGNMIPYSFHDIRSFADLYYCSRSKEFVAVTLLYDELKRRTAVKVFTLSSPPEVYTAASVKMLGNRAGWYILSLALVGLMFVLFFYFRKKKQSPAGNLTHAVMEVAGDDPVILKKPAVKNSISLFGGLQVFDRTGNDITKMLSPLIRELFLVVLLYSIKWERGISTEKLTEILWFDKSVDSARNNRSVNIAKLKLILDKMDSCQISKETGYWKIIFDENRVKIDYNVYLRILHDKGKMDRQKVNELTEIVQQGSFLSNVEYEWLDAFKSEISNEIIDAYLHFAASIKIADDPELLIKLASCIFYFDQVNEEAMVMQCKALVHLGKHSLAKTKFETFIKEYRNIYGEEFKRRFNEVIES